jgi:mRNA interferase ChpB
MPRAKVVQPGDIYWIDPNPVAGRAMRDRHRFVVITPMKINRLGVAMTVPVMTGAASLRPMGLTVPITGHDTSGVAVCHQVCSFDIEARIATGTARFIETLDEATLSEIIARVVSVIDPAG